MLANECMAVCNVELAGISKLCVSHNGYSGALLTSGALVASSDYSAADRTGD